MEAPFASVERPVGRPRTPETETISVRIEAKDRPKVDALVDATGHDSLSSLIRDALNHYARTAPVPPKRKAM